MNALFLALLLSAGPNKSEGAHYPLAAALVIEDSVVIVDVTAKTLTPILTPGLSPEEADLSFDKRLVAFNARAANSPRSAIYVYATDTHAISKLELQTKGDARLPRFDPSGESLYFTAAVKDAPGNIANPGQVYRWTRASNQTELVKTNDELCHFSPVEGLGGSVAYLETTCMLNFKLRETNPKTGESGAIASVHGATAELATALDRKALFYTAPTLQGTDFMVLREGQDKPTRIAAKEISGRIQPRFVCPKDIVFVSESRVQMLDSKTGAISTIAAFKRGEFTLKDGGSK